MADPNLQPYFDAQVGGYVDPRNNTVTMISGYSWDEFVDDAKDVGRAAVEGVGTVAGAVGGPVGMAVGGEIGEGLGNLLFGEEAPATPAARTQTQGQTPTPGPSNMVFTQGDAPAGMTPTGCVYNGDGEYHCPQGQAPDADASFAGRMQAKAGPYRGEMVDVYRVNYRTQGSRPKGAPAIPANYPTSPASQNGSGAGYQNALFDDGGTVDTTAQAWANEAFAYLSSISGGFKIVKALAKKFGLIRGNHSEMDAQCTHALAQTLPVELRKALWQFTCGFPAPINLTPTAEDVFVILKLAQSGHKPQVCCGGNMGCD